MDQRPEYLRIRKNIKNKTLTEILSLKKEVREQEARADLGEAAFHRDGKPKTVKHREQSDNGTTKLHPARNHRQPLVPPKAYYKDVPKKREEIIRNFPQDHLGSTGHVSETTVGKMHNRSVILTFDNFGKSSYKPGKGGDKGSKYSDQSQLQEGLCNYATMLHAIWPMDYTGIVMWRVLIEGGWGNVAGGDERKKSELCIEFFNAILHDNCGKAVHDQYPCVYEQMKAKWQRLVEKMYPRYPSASAGAGSSSSHNNQNSQSGSSGQKNKNSAGTGNSSSRGGTKSGASSNRGGGYSSRGGGGGGSRVNPRPTNAGPIAKDARGLEVCFGYNNKNGCRRIPIDATTCRDQHSQVLYAHFCSNWNKSTSIHCLKPHSRHGNH
jgi:hypothetical protein